MARLRDERAMRLLGAEVRAMARRSDIRGIRHALEQGADVESVDGEGKSALHWACEYGNFKTVRFLVGLGADPGLTDQFSYKNALHWAIDGGNIEACAWMAQLNPEWGLKEDVSGYTPLHLAAVAGEEEWQGLAASMAGIAIEKLGIDAARQLCRPGVSLKVFDQAYSWWESREVARSAKAGKPSPGGPARI